MKRLFPRHREADLRCDYEGLYSLTPQNESIIMAEIMADVCWQVLRKPASRTRILDGTAGLGGNVMGFARLFGRVQALEVDPNRFLLLQHNMSELGLIGTGRVECQRGSVLRLSLRAAVPLLFLDPPWGGTRTGAPSSWTCASTEHLCTRCCGVGRAASGARPTVVGLKLPTNFALQNFETALRAAAIQVYSTHASPRCCWWWWSCASRRAREDCIWPVLSPTYTSTPGQPLRRRASFLCVSPFTSRNLSGNTAHSAAGSAGAENDRDSPGAMAASRKMFVENVVIRE